MNREGGRIPLRDSTSLLSDQAALRGRYAEDGYLFLRGVLPLTPIEHIRDDLYDAITAQGFTRSDPTSDVFDIKTRTALDEHLLHETLDFEPLWSHPDVLALFEKVLGASPFVFKTTNIRVMVPDDVTNTSTMHQDAYYVRDNGQFSTIWAPLTRVEADTAPLRLWPGSHLREELLPVTGSDRFSTALNMAVPAINSDALSSGWTVAAPVAPGDALIFHRYMAHESLVNRSQTGRVRMSIDTRFQPIGDRRGPTVNLTHNERLKLQVNDKGVLVE